METKIFLSFFFTSPVPFSSSHVPCLFHIECIAIVFLDETGFGLVVYLETKAFVALLLYYQSFFLSQCYISDSHLLLNMYIK